MCRALSSQVNDSVAGHALMRRKRRADPGRTISAEGLPEKAIFLDFDGVLHPANASSADWFCRMSYLVESVKNADVQIVISSSWRFHHPMEYLMTKFPPELRCKIVGKTAGAFVGKHARWNEIQAYCELRSIDEWRALDDSAYEFPSPCQELVVCDGARGMQKEQLEQIQAWLGVETGA